MDPALLLCPAFNLTFTIVTRLNNTYTKRLPYPPPRCYCNKPVLLDLRSIKYNHRSYFVCSDYDHIDAPLRCGFFAWADQVRCRIPDTLPHSHSSLAQPSSPPSSSSSSWQHHQQILSPSSPVPPPWSPLLSSTSYSSTSVSDHDHQQQSQQQSKPYFSADMPPFLPSSRESIPSTPSTTSARTFPINYDEDASIYTPRTSKIDNPIYALASSGRSGAKAEEGKDCSTGASDEFVRLLQGAKMPLWHTSTKEQGDPNDLRSGTSLLDALNGVKAGGGGNDNESTSASSSLPGSPQQRETTALRGVYGLLIPGSVYMRQAIKKKNTDIARAKEKQMTEEKLEELRQQIASMEETIRDLEAENQKERAAKQVKEEELSDLINKQEKHAVDAQELIQKAEKLLADKEEITASMQQVQEILAEETMLREKSQRRRIKLEMILYDILAMNESLKQEMAEKEEKLSMKDLKCRVCFQENIEFALVPCYHCCK
ncbi:hypothetical protein BDB00DRAFT_618522 [Zychaea mexicana]|uniref:uncharacterized protein n=1 Tax=Zychaea mexicana TaxID=64656 RepID=UPI0022FECFE3|nr:uncharacterized protein BDB00DRAFT_618522 [Zychaea mexicana]KAI9489349.1 hypothetical protein BDB00DRAFT_618522 [Zychaea mexicana]